MNTITVCYECPNRTKDCHTKCHAYLKAKMKHDLMKLKRQKDAEVERTLTDNNIKRIDQRAKKCKGKRVGQR